MGQTHANAYAHMRQTKVTRVFDQDLARARQIADQLGATPTDRIDDVLNDDGIQAVDVCLPTDLHREFVVKAAAKGKHVFSEKPIARSLEDAQAMKQACDDAGVKLMVGHVLRFFSEYKAAHDVVKSGRIGKPAVIRARRLSAFPKWSVGNWYADYERSGGPIVDLIIHDIDFIRWTFGEVKRVYARAKDHHALVTMRLESGAICHVEGSWAHPDGAPFVTSLEIAASNGLYSTDNADNTAVWTKTTTAGRFTYSPESPATDPYRLELESFYDSIINDTPPPVTGTDAIGTLAVVLAAYESALSGQPVDVKGAVS